MNEEASRPSKLMLEEAFLAEDDRFLDELVKFRSRKILTALLDRWLSDDRSWARQQVINYLHCDLNFAGHEVVFKRFFRHYEECEDHEMMTHFMVVLDRLVRRNRVVTYHSTWRPRASWTEERLLARPNRTIVDTPPEPHEIKTTFGGTYTYLKPGRYNKPANRLFTHRTRNYLRRRVWRYFRFLSYRDSAAYLRETASALCLYEDVDFQTGENIIDNWSLMHACFFGHKAVRFGAAHTNLVDGHSLAELNPAPFRPELWDDPTAAPELVRLICDASSTFVRMWAMELLRSRHRVAIGQLDIKTLSSMLAHTDPRVQTFATELFAGHSGLANLPVTSWLDLLESVDPAVLPTVCNAIERHVTLERFSTEQILKIVVSAPVPVAKLGFELLKNRHADSALSSQSFITLTRMQCDSEASEVIRWVFEQQSFPVDEVVEFFDSLSKPVRLEALRWLAANEGGAATDPLLWTRLIETPFDDVRIELIRLLERQSSATVESDSLIPLWSSVILGVHTGGRAKLHAIDQLRDRIAQDHSLAAPLFPVLAVAIRSVRRPEQRRAISAVATLLERAPAIASIVEEYFPDLEIEAMNVEVGL